ncbi:aromatic hydrocarbon degradation membrane protein, partial [Candidatus Magnetobacterium bavaricum]
MMVNVRRLLVFVLGLICGLALNVEIVFATNGTNLHGIGPISTSMGGVGIAQPLDSLSVVFSNPAGATAEGELKYDFDIGGSLLMPKARATINISGSTISDKSADHVFVVPNIAVSVPLDNTWSVGFGMAGASGFGVDYRNTKIEQPYFYNLGALGKLPLTAVSLAQLQVLKVAPYVSYRPTDKLSFGISPQINYGIFDLGKGSTNGYSLGVLLGTRYKLTDIVSLGATYTSAQNINYKNIYDLNSDGSADNFKLESPQQVGFGVAVEPLKDVLLFETDLKWLNWANAKGYKDSDWEDQWVVGLGVQYKPIKHLSLRTGYNYGKNPIKSHNNFIGSTMSEIQGKQLPTYYYETFRIIGTPLLIEHNLSFGVGYEVSDRVSLHAGYT